MNNLQAAQEQWDGRTPQDDDLPDEHEYTGDIYLKQETFDGLDHMVVRAEFVDGTLEGLVFIDPEHLTSVNLSNLIDTAHEKAMELWLEEQADYADDEDGY